MDMLNPSSPTKKLLVVEDDPTIRETLQQILEFEGYSVDTASNGREGLEQLKANWPDMILLDLMMPVMDGWQFAQAIETERKDHHTSLVIFSAFDDKAREINCDGVVRKPFNLQALLSTVKTHCH